MARAEFQLETLTCPSCIKKIESAVTKIEGVDSVKLLFNASKVKTEFDDSQTNAEQIGGVINKLGYAVLSTKVS